MVKSFHKILLAVVTMLLLSLSAEAQTTYIHLDSLKHSVIFRQDYRYIEMGFRNNRENLERAAADIREAQRTGTLQSVEIKAYASPEGGERYNERLALARTQQIAKWIAKNCDIPADSIKQFAGGVGWDMFRDTLALSDIYYRDEVLEILDSIPIWTKGRNGKLYESRKRALVWLQDGKPWRDMNDRFFPDIRCGVSIVVVRRMVPAIEPVKHSSVKAVTLLSPILSRPVREVKKKQSLYLAVKTNTVEDLASIPNLGIEFHMGRGWTTYLDWQYSWWKNDNRKWYWRTYGGDLGIRKYFGRNAETGLLRGHHLGIYGQIYTYDFLLPGETGIMGGQPGGNIFDLFNYGGGIEYGYSLRLAHQLNLDLTVGFGYFGGEYHEYQPVDNCYLWMSTNKRNYWGPTKAEISLVWLIGLDKWNQRRGGAR